MIGLIGYSVRMKQWIRRKFNGQGVVGKEGGLERALHPRSRDLRAIRAVNAAVRAAAPSDGLDATLSANVDMLA